MAKRQMYYFEGSVARKIEYGYAEPAREPERRPERSPQRQTRTETAPKRKLTEKAERAYAFNFKYTMFVISMILVMVVACGATLYMESRINEQQDNVEELEDQLKTIQDDNLAYESSLNNMYTLDDIYNVATSELGMVYAKKGQTVYYESANEDYVKQYQDVPEAN